MTFAKDEQRPSVPAQWTLRELLPWAVLVMLAVGVFLQQRRLEELRSDFKAELQTAGNEADKRMAASLEQLSGRVDATERQLRQCMQAIDNASPQ